MARPRPRPRAVTAAACASALVLTAGAVAVAQSGDTLQRDAYPSAREQARERQELRDRQRAYDRLGRTGNAIFFHPDGTGPNHWALARAYWVGPDRQLNWDRLPYKALYRGAMSDQLAGTSNGGATTHAFGYRVSGPGSFGKDGDGSATPPTDRSIDALSGYPGSVMREAANSGRPVGVVNDGMIAEPGTGAFLAEVGNRDDTTGISEQILLGRPGARDRPVQVILGGGEADFLPEGTPQCAPGRIRLTCRVHSLAAGDGSTTTGKRTDGRNLLVEADRLGYEVVRTRDEFERLAREVQRRPGYAPRVLGLFAAVDLFNDVPEEVLIRAGLVDPSIPATDKRSNLILWGDRPGTPSYDPPTTAEMSRLAVTILDRAAERRRLPYLLVTEPESTDNFANNNNAIGELNALKRADDALAVFRQAIRRDPRTLLITAADSDASGMQLQAYPAGREPERVGSINVNPTGDRAQDVNAPLDGLYGRGTVPFRAAPDQFGQSLAFAVAWAGGPDFAGGIVSRAEGWNAELLQETFSGRFDNVDVYRMLYLTLFDEALRYPEGRRAPTR